MIFHGRRLSESFQKSRLSVSAWAAITHRAWWSDWYPKQELVFALTAPPIAYTERNILVGYESAEGKFDTGSVVLHHLRRLPAKPSTGVPICAATSSATAPCADHEPLFLALERF